jgi:hypothetical protein
VPRKSSRLGDIAGSVIEYVRTKCLLILNSKRLKDKLYLLLGGL